MAYLRSPKMMVDVSAIPMMNVLEFFVIAMPVWLTCAGKTPVAVLTRFWTSESARSGSRPRLKVAVMELDPSSPLVEEM